MLSRPSTRPDMQISPVQCQTKIVNIKKTGAVTIISRHFKIFISVPSSNALDTVCTGHPLLSHHLPPLPVFLWSVQSPDKSGNHRLRGRTVPLELFRKYFRKVTEVIVTRSRSLFFSSPMMTRIISRVRYPPDCIF